MESPVFEEPKALESVIALADRAAGLSPSERVNAYLQLVRSGHLDTMAQALPLLLNLKGKPYTLIDHFPFEEIFRFRMPAALVYKTGRQVSKTVHTGTGTVYDAYGRRRPITSFKVGDHVLTVDPHTFATSTGTVTALHTAPEKVCYRITTRRGAVLELADTHPLRQLRGWVAAKDLRVRDRIAHVSVGGVFGNQTQDDVRVRLTAYMLGDGSYRQQYNFTALRGSRALAEVRDLCARDNARYRNESGRRAGVVRFGRSHPIYGWAREDGLHDKLSHEKHIPGWVFRLPREQTITFIERLWAVDGMLKQDKTKPQIRYTSTSRALIYDLKSLLLKFRIPCSIKRRKTGYRKKDGTHKRGRDAFVLRVETRQGRQIFLDTFAVPDKPVLDLRDIHENNNRHTVPIEVGDIIAEIAGECRGTNKEALLQAGLRKKPKYALSYDKLARYVEFFREHRSGHPRLPELERLLHGDLEWDEIVSIEEIGPQPCADIEVAATHNYVMDGIVSHNSTSLAAHGVVLSASIPNRTTLYVMPLFEQVRRFSSMFVQPFIEQSPVKRLWVGTDTVNSVLHRSFRNNSKMLFSFAFLNADRVRGISADKVAIDESVHKCTLVTTPNGVRQIQYVRPGDIVAAFDEDGKVIWTTVQKQWYAGKRYCYRVHYANGRYVDATLESFVATTTGCYRVSEIIEAAVRRGSEAEGSCSQEQKAEADYSGEHTSAGIAAGRCAHNRDGQIYGGARLLSAGVPLAQVHDIARIRSRHSVAVEEERARLYTGTLLDCQHLNLQGLQADLVPGRDEAHYKTVPGSDRSGGLSAERSLVAGRRREPLGPATLADAGVLYSRLPVRRGRTFMPMDDGSRVSVLDFDGGQAPKVPCVSNAVCEDGSRSAVDTRAGGWQPDGAAYAIQAPTYWEERFGDLYVLRETIPIEDLTPQNGSSSVPALQKQRVQLSAATHGVSPVYVEAGQTRSTQCADTATTTRSGGAQEDKHNQSRMGTRSSREDERVQKEASGEATCSTGGSDAPVHSMRQGAAAGRTRESDAKSMPRVSAGVHAAERQAATLSEEGARAYGDCSRGVAEKGGRDNYTFANQIVAIECVGLCDVYDLENTAPHTVLLNGCAQPQCQDMNHEHLPIIRETMSASDLALRQFTGTPKTLDNTLEGLWQDSSQAEWFVPCLHCTTHGHPTWNIPTMEFHLEKMIGPYHREISEKHPATICHKCGQPISPRLGRWVHRYPDRVWEQAGYHVPQIIMPLHYAKPEKWAELLAKMMGRGNTPLNVFYNEVLGESYDTAAKLVTLTEIDRVSDLGANSIAKARGRAGKYSITVMGVDWGGGGEKQISFTTVALLGLRRDGVIDVLYGQRLLTPHDHLREAKEIKRLWDTFRPTILAHDYTGAGALRETFLVQAGIPTRMVMPCQYVRSASQQPCYHVAPTQQHPRSHYRVDKSRSLLLTCAMIKCQRLHFFDSDYKSQEDPGLIRDFLALVEDKVTTMAAGEIYRITRQEGFTDDFAQAVNLGCVAIWYRTRRWPRLDELIDYAITEEQLRAAAPMQDSDWDDELLEG